MLRLLAALVALTALAPAALAQQKGRKIAFLVGVGTYKHGLADLGAVPNNDVAKLGDELRNSGFTVVTLTGEKATKKEIETRFRALLDGNGDSDKSLGRGDVVLVQLCMHGFTLEVNGKKEPFLAGHDGKADDQATLIGLNSLIRTASPFGASMFFLVDACREITDANRGVEGAPMALPKNMAVLFSCAQGQLAHQPDSLQHGLFTYAVLKVLRGETGLDGNATWADIVSHVGKAFRLSDIRKHIPAGRPQTPLAVQGETEDAELVSVRRAAPGDQTTKEARAKLLSDHKEVQRAFLDHGDELDHCLRRLVPARATAWKAASDAGEPLGHALFALCLMEGIGFDLDLPRSHKVMLKAAAAGDSWAMLGVGAHFYYGLGVEQDYKQAMEWYQKSAKLGNHHAMNSIGNLYENAYGVKEDDAEAVKWFKASSVAYPTATYNLGRKYERGEGVPRDLKVAVECYEKAISNGVEQAMHRLAKLHISGTGVPKDEVEAVRLLRLGTDRRHPDSMNQLGRMYAEGRGGLDRDPKMAVALYRGAAVRGLADAQNNLGYMYLEGTGVPQDDKKALEWFEKAAAQQDPEGQFNVGFMFENGRGVERNYQSAMVNYKKAAKGGFTDAKYYLGRMYHFARGVERNYPEALKWYKDAAADGHAAAMNAVGFLTEMGRGTPKNETVAFGWYTKSAAKGNASGQFNLADLYENGREVAQDTAKAFDLYTKSASQGNRGAMYRLGRCHENGTGTRKDLAKAREWYKKAADAGDEDAKKALERLRK